jgi:hypothetical protein
MQFLQNEWNRKTIIIKIVNKDEKIIELKNKSIKNKQKQNI